MLRACNGCGREVNTRDLHNVNYSGDNLCDKCYTQDVKKEEDYYDYCVANEYSYDSKDGKESRRTTSYSDKKFFK